MARTPKVLNTNPRLTPPPSLGARPRAVFEAIVGQMDPDHFVSSDLPLLTEYARAVDLADQAAEALEESGAVSVDGTSMNRWVLVGEKAVRSMVALAMRLRLSPQSRFDRLKAATNARGQSGPKPWETHAQVGDVDPLAEFRHDPYAKFRRD